MATDPRQDTARQGNDRTARARLARLAGAAGLGVLLAITAAGDARAEEPLALVTLSDSQQGVVERVLHAEGYLNGDLHRRFWSALPTGLSTPGPERARFLERLRRTLSVGMRYQRALWASIEASRAANRVVRIAGYDQAKLEAAALAREAGRGNADFALQTARSLTIADQMLRAAANNTPVVLPSGVIDMSPESVAGILSRVDAAMTRVDRLADPSWPPAPVTMVHDEAGMTLTSPLPFVKDVDLRAGQQGKRLRTVTLSQRRSETDFTFVTYTEFSGPWRDAQAGMERLAGSAIATALRSQARGARTQAPEIEAGAWRERLSAVASGSADVAVPEDEAAAAALPQGARIHASARAIHFPERNAVVNVLAVTSRSARDAAVLRAGVEGMIVLRP